MSISPQYLESLLDQFSDSHRKNIVAVIKNRANLPEDCVNSTDIARRFFELGRENNYEKIVNDVAKIIGVSTDGYITVIESNILKYFSVVDISKFSVDKAELLIKDAVRIAQVEFKPVPALGVASMVALGGVKGRMLSTLLERKTTKNCDYNAVIPALVMIAGYRILNNRASLGPGSSLKSEKYSYYPVVKSEEGGSSVEACVTDKPMGVQWLELDTDSRDDISSLSPLLSNLPGLVAKADTHTANYMIVKVNGKLIPSATGSDKYRAMSRDFNGKIANHAELLKPDRLKKLVNSGVLFNLASTIVAQVHLADISRKLDQMKQQLEDLKQARIDDRAAKIESIREKYAQWSALNQDFNADKRLSVIEQFDCDLGECANSIEGDIKRESDKLEKLSVDDEWFGTGNYHEEVLDLCKLITVLIEQWYFLMQLRISGVQFLAQVPGEESQAISNYKILREDILNKSFGSEFISDVKALFRSKASMKSRFNSSSTLNERKSGVLAFCNNIVDNSIRVSDRLPDFEAFSGACNSHEKLLHMEYKNGEIVRIGVKALNR